MWEAGAGVVGDRQSGRRPHRRSHWSEARHLSRGLSSIYVPICLPVSPIHLSPDIASVAPSGPLSFSQMVHTHIFLSNGTHTFVYTCTRRHTTQVLNMRACTHIHTHTHTGDDDGNGICRVLFCRHVRVGSNIGRHLRRWQRRVHCGGLRPRCRLPPFAGFCLTLSTPCFLPLVPLPPCPLAGCVGASLSCLRPVRAREKGMCKSGVMTRTSNGAGGGRGQGPGPVGSVGVSGHHVWSLHRGAAAGVARAHRWQ